MYTLLRSIATRASQLTLLVSFLCLFDLPASAVQKFWIGASGGSWATTTNWSPSGVPTSADSVTFNTNVTVVDVPTVTIQGVRVVGSVSVTLKPITTANATLTCNPPAAGKSLFIELGSTLNVKGIDAATDRTLTLVLAASRFSHVAGTLIAGADDPALTGTAGLITNSGTIEFEGSASYEHARDGGILPGGTWRNSANAMIYVTGIRGTSFSSSLGNGVTGNVIWNCPNQTAACTLTTQNSTWTFTSFTINNTGSGSVVGSTASQNYVLNIQGNLTVGNGTNNATFNLRSANNNTSTINVGDDVIVNANGTLSCSVAATATTLSFGGVTGVSNTACSIGGAGTFSLNNVNLAVSATPASLVTTINTSITARNLTVTTNTLAFSSSSDISLSVNDLLTSTGTIDLSQSGRAHSVTVRANGSGSLNLLPGNSTFTYSRGGSTQNICGGNYNNLTITNTSGNQNRSLQGNVTVLGKFFLNNNGSGGNLELNGRTLDVRGDFERTTLGIIAGNATSKLRFRGSATHTSDIRTTGSDFSVVEFDRSAATTIASASGVLRSVDSLKLTQGTITTNSKLSIASTTGHLYRKTGTLSVAPTFGSPIGMVYASSVTTGNELPTSTTTIGKFELVGSGITVTLGANATVNTSLILTNGYLSLGAFNLSLAAAATVSGASASSHVITNGNGRLIKAYTSAAQFAGTYPFGDGVDYTPVTVSQTGFSGSGNLTLGLFTGNTPFTSPVSTQGANHLKRLIFVSASAGTFTDITASYTYLDADIVGSEGSYVIKYNDGATGFQTPSATLNLNTATNNVSFTATSLASFNGYWGAGVDADLSSLIFKSIASGNYSTNSIWDQGVAPGGSDLVEIQSGHTVELTANTSAGALTVKSGGRLNTSTFVLSGSNFILSSGGILGIGSAVGITSSAATGSIQTTVRSFSDGATYVYNAPDGSQVTGDGLPTTLNNGKLWVETVRNISSAEITPSSVSSGGVLESLPSAGSIVNNSGYPANLSNVRVRLLGKHSTNRGSGGIATISTDASGVITGISLLTTNNEGLGAFYNQTVNNTLLIDFSAVGRYTVSMFDQNGSNATLNRNVLSLSSDLVVNGTGEVRVKTGSILFTNGQSRVISGTGSFVVEDDAILSCEHTGGYDAAITTTSKSFSTNGGIEFYDQRTGAQTINTGNNLPVTLKYLVANRTGTSNNLVAFMSKQTNVSGYLCANNRATFRHANVAPFGRIKVLDKGWVIKHNGGSNTPTRFQDSTGNAQAFVGGRPFYDQPGSVYIAYTGFNSGGNSVVGEIQTGPTDAYVFVSSSTGQLTFANNSGSVRTETISSIVLLRGTISLGTVGGPPVHLVLNGDIINRGGSNVGFFALPQRLTIGGSGTVTNGGVLTGDVTLEELNISRVGVTSITANGNIRVTAKLTTTSGCSLNVAAGKTLTVGGSGYDAIILANTDAGGAVVSLNSVSQSGSNFKSGAQVRLYNSGGSSATAIFTDDNNNGQIDDIAELALGAGGSGYGVTLSNIPLYVTDDGFDDGSVPTIDNTTLLTFSSGAKLRVIGGTQNIEIPFTQSTLAKLTIENTEGVSFAGPGNSYYVDSVIVNTGGILNLGANNLTTKHISGSGTFNADNNSAIMFNGNTAAVTLPSTVTSLRSLGINKSTNNLSIAHSITVTDSLKLLAGSLDNSGGLTLSDGATIVRRSGSSLTNTPTFGTTVNVEYAGTSSLTMDNEIPSSGVLSNLTIGVGSGNTVTTASSFDMSGELTLTSGVLNVAGGTSVTYNGTNPLPTGSTTSYVSLANSSSSFLWDMSGLNSGTDYLAPLGMAGSINGYRPVILSKSSGTFGSVLTFKLYNHTGGLSVSATNVPSGTNTRANYIAEVTSSTGELVNIGLESNVSTDYSTGAGAANAGTTFLFNYNGASWDNLGFISRLPNGSNTRVKINGYTLPSGSPAYFLHANAGGDLPNAFSTNYVFVATSGAWDNSTNWSPSGIPGSLDNITIGSGRTVTIGLGDAFAVNNINMSGTGTTISLTDDGSLSINGTVTYSGNGTVSSAGTSSVTYSGSNQTIIPGTYYSLSTNSTGACTKTLGGNVSIAASGALFVYTGIAISNGAFNISMGNGSTINRTKASYGTTDLSAYPDLSGATSINVNITGGTGGITLSYEIPTSSTKLNNLVLNTGGAGNAITFQQSATVNGALTLNGGGIINLAGSSSYTFNGAIVLSNTANRIRANSGGTSSVTIAGSGALPATKFLSGTNPFGNFTLSRAQTVVFNDESVSLRNLTISSGSVSFGNATLTLTGSSLSLSGATPLITTAATNITTAINTAFSLPNSLTINNLTVGSGNYPSLSGTGSTFTINGVLTINGLSSFSPGNNTVAFNGGNIAGNTTPAALNFGTSTNLVFGGSTSGITIPSGISNIGSLTISNSNSAGVTMGGSLTVNGTLTLSANRLTIGNNTLTLNGAVVQSGGVFTGSSTSKLVIAGSGSYTGSFAFGPTAVNRVVSELTLNRSSVTLNLLNNLNVGTKLALINGTLNSGSGFVTLDNNANIERTNGSITGTNSPTTTSAANDFNVIYRASNITGNELTGSNNFKNLTVLNGSAVTLGSNVVCDGTINLQFGTLTVGANTLTLKAPVSYSAGFSAGATSSIILQSTAALPSTVTELNNLTLSSANNSSLSNDLTVNGTLTVGSGCTLSASNRTLTFNNDAPLSLTGTLSTSSSTNLVFNGTLPFNLSGPRDLGNLTIGAGDAALIGGTVSVYGRLRLSSTGNLSSNGFLSLKGSATSNAYVVNNSTGVVTGATTMERWLTPFQGYIGLGARHLASPMDSGSTYSQLVAGDGAPFVETWDETAFNGTTGSAWTSFTGPLLNHTVGYSVRTTANKAVALTGKLANGDYGVDVTRTGTNGWNLIGNPYPSAIDWDLVTADPTYPAIADLSTARYTWATQSATAGTWLPYVNGLPATRRFVPSMSSFLVRVYNGPQTITFKNSHRVTTANYSHSRVGQDLRPVAYINVVNNSNPSLRDESIMYFENGATLGQDSKYDALKMSGSNSLPSIAARMSNVNLAINGMPIPGAQPTVVPLSVRVPSSGTWSIRTGDMKNMENYTLFLQDNDLGIVHNLTTDSVYSFTMPAGTVNNTRFQIGFATLGTTGAAEALNNNKASVKAYPNPTTADNINLAIRGLSNENLNVRILNLLGSEVYSENLSGSEGSVKLNASNLSKGVYVVEVNGVSGKFTQRLTIE